MDLDNFNRKKYTQGTYSILEGETIILVEGKSNKLFYRKFKEINSIPILVPSDVSSGKPSSCSTIKKLIESNESFYGIIDRDLNNSNLAQNNLFVLNYYSLENIVLLKHKKFERIKSELMSFLNDKDLNEYKFRSYTLCNQIMNIECPSYNIGELKVFERQFHAYREDTIIDIKCYLQYMSVKDLVEKFDSYLPILNKGHKKNNYFEELYDELEDKSFLNLFSHNQHEDIKNICVDL